MMSLQSWADDLLPTKWSRRIAVATVLATVTVYGLPSLLPLSLVPTSPEHLLLVRLFLCALAALTGTLIVLILVVRSHTAQSKQIVELQQQLAARPDPPKSPPKLPPINYDNRGIV